MAQEIPFRHDFSFEYGRLESVAPHLRRIVARNPSPFTFKGTGTYVVGEGEVAVIDPGPDLPEHVEALLAALSAERVTHILVTHTHRDHSPAARALKAATGAPTYGFGPHMGGEPREVILRGAPGRRGDSRTKSGDRVEEGGDFDFVPDIRLSDGDGVVGKGWRLEAVHTPGHTSNHLSFAWAEEGILFSGDHVMGWSTSVIAPPDGDMGAYMASLEKLLSREDRLYWPTHGPAICDPKPYVRAFMAHRREREEGVLGCLSAGIEDIPGIVERLYPGLDPRLTRAAGRSIYAHLLDLARRGLALSDGPPSLEARWRRTLR